MKQYIIFLPLLFLSCQSKPAETAVDSLVVMAAENKVDKSQIQDTPIPKVQEEEENINDHIYKALKLEFTDSRNNLLATAKQEQLDVSSITESETSLHYTVIYPDNQGVMENICYPYKGELLMGFKGNKDIAKMYLDGAALSKEWAIHRTTENGDFYETTVKLPNYPLNIIYTITYTQTNENEAIFFQQERQFQLI